MQAALFYLHTPIQAAFGTCLPFRFRKLCCRYALPDYYDLLTYIGNRLWISPLIWIALNINS